MKIKIFMATQLERLISPFDGITIPDSLIKENDGYVECGLCYAKILEREAYISPGGHPYCNEGCFILYTED